MAHAYLTSSHNNPHTTNIWANMPNKYKNIIIIIIVSYNYYNYIIGMGTACILAVAPNSNYLA